MRRGVCHSDRSATASPSVRSCLGECAGLCVGRVRVWQLRELTLHYKRSRPNPSSPIQKYLGRKHTILLVQTPNSKVYEVFGSLSNAIQHLMDLYEKKLGEMNPGQKNITYDVSDFFKCVARPPARVREWGGRSHAAAPKRITTPTNHHRRRCRLLATGFWISSRT